MATPSVAAPAPAAPWVHAATTACRPPARAPRRDGLRQDGGVRVEPLAGAQAELQAKGTYLRDKFHRLKARMGTKKAAMAMAHKILVAAFHMLQRSVGFADFGADPLDRVNKHRTAKRLARRLDAVGYDVMLRPKAEA